ncbi:MAG: tetratricopeptide repeat protein [Gemmatimonadetes bacterium]|nr:tetratricopeptide repeat protein [Gemmatimonadota bacterium]
MPRHPTARRVPHQPTGPDDPFLAQVVEAAAWAKQHARGLVIGGALLALGIASILYYTNYRSRLRTQADAQLAELRSNPTPAVTELENFLTRFRGTAAAKEVRLLLAERYLSAGQAEKAVSTLQPLAGDLDAPLGTSAAFLLAAAEEARGAADAAEQTYLRIAEKAEFDSQRREALNLAAGLRLQRGDASGAAQVYERALELTAEDLPERALLEMRLAEALARRGTAAPRGS